VSVEVKSNIRIKIASKLLFLKQTWLLQLLKVLIILGLVSALYVFLPLKELLDIPFLPFVAKVLVFVASIAFPLYVFISNYFYEMENAQKLGGNLYQGCELELIPVMDALVAGKKPDHLLKMVTKMSKVGFAINKMSLSGEQLQGIVDFWSQTNPENLKEVLESAVQEATEEQKDQLSATDLFFGFVMIYPERDRLLRELELTEEDFGNIIQWSDTLFDGFNHPKRLKEKLKASEAGIAQNWSSGYTLYLDRFGHDITNPRAFGNSSSEGRENVILQMENALTKAGKNSCILTGSVGVGKTALVYGFAKKLYWGESREGLNYQRIFNLDMTALLAGVETPGEAAARLAGILNDAVWSGNVILFIDGIEKLFSGARQGVGTIDATEVILPYLENSGLRLIGVTTESDYQTYIAPKASLSACFEKVEVGPTDQKQTMRILEDMSLIYGSQYRVDVTYPALKEIYQLSDMYVTNKQFPAKAIDVLNDVCATAKSQGMPQVDKRAVKELAAKIFDAPINEVQEEEKSELINLEEKLHQRMVGQEEAVKAVADALRRARAQVGSRKKPIGSFLFLGPTGVGKTELSKTLAWSYFGSENKMIRMDMNQFQGADSVDRFIGKKLTGTDQLEGGEFVKMIRQGPFSVVLLDEIEKAHPDILNLFLQMLDEGYITDGMGEKVIVRNSIVIATSNAGANMIRDGIREGKDLGELKEELLTDLQNQGIYRPEFLNRFDDVILFKPLTPEELKQIAMLMFQSTIQNMKTEGYLIDIEPEALDYLASLGYKPEFGAREMRRVFQDKLESFLAKKILDNSIKKGESYKVALSDIK
jgi:ATP-dependent Clp protease ATP-binding subunit ClpC